MLVEFSPTRGDMEVAFVSDGTYNPAQGVRGGGVGGSAYQGIRSTNDAAPVPTANSDVVTLHPGENIVSHCCGGGGYGDPAERDPDLVAQDVKEGWVSPNRAREIYRVALTADGGVDAEATAALRG